MSRPAGDDVRHPALQQGQGRPPAEATLSDRQRVGVILQASSLLSHLELAGRRLSSGWEGAVVDGAGLLRGLRSVPGPVTQLPQRALRDLAVSLFRADRKIAGRGEARRAVRELFNAWDQHLTPIPPERTTEQILEAARFLWHRSMGSVRATLAAVHVRDGDESLWVAGPEWFRRPLLEGVSSIGDVEERLASDAAESLWRGGRHDPGQLAAAGRWRSAVAAWRSRKRETPDERLEFSRALLAVGRFREALGELRYLRRPAAVVLRVIALHRLGELRRAKRELGKLESIELAGESLLAAAAVATRLFGNRDEAGNVQGWVERALEESTTPGERARAELVACAAAWDRGDDESMKRHLEAAKPALGEPDLAWRWHKAKGLRSIGHGDGKGAARSLRESLATSRRRLTPAEAGDLWNELALARSLSGDLVGAERALLHTLRLHRDVEGPRKTTLALFNLAEVRLRRGRLEGVREIIEQSSEENRSAGNWRGIVHDTELWARYLLVRGRPSAAVDHLEKAIEEFDSRRLSWHRPQLQTLLARALGWLGRSEEAARELVAAGPEGLADLEPEERPAVWAQAGDRESALESITRADPTAPIWTALLTGGEPSDSEWRRTELLDAYRMARLTFDLELLEPGWVPAHLVHRATAVLRRSGASAQAEQLEHRETGAWEAVASYLERASAERDSIEKLFFDSGYGEARLVLRLADREDEVLVGGSGGPVELRVPVAGGDLQVRSSWVDAVLKVLVRLVARDLEGAMPPVAGRATDEQESSGGMVGESPALQAALRRLAQLAPERVPILLVGETGTGKELAARHVHRLSSRREGPFLPLNCAAVAEELLMSDLFGHVRGAFTSAVRDRVGVFEMARQGTVFLDEIGDLPLRAQGFLLRVLQEGEVRRVGESLHRTTDVRVITATHRDLEKMVRDGLFRADLYYRLRVAKVVLPPLRDRGDDIVLLARHFLAKLRPGEVPKLSAAARSALRAHHWPGNVRELENVLSVAVAMSSGRSLTPADLDLPYGGSEPTVGYHEKVLEYRRRLVREALVQSGGNRAQAARQLGLTRQALSYLVRKLKIDG